MVKISQWTSFTRDLKTHHACTNHTSVCMHTQTDTLSKYLLSWHTSYVSYSAMCNKVTAGQSRTISHMLCVYFWQGQEWVTARTLAIIWSELIMNIRAASALQVKLLNSQFHLLDFFFQVCWRKAWKRKQILRGPYKIKWGFSKAAI